MVLSGSRRFSVVLVGSQCLSVVLVGSHRFSVVHSGCVCSQWFFMIVMGSQCFL